MSLSGAAEYLGEAEPVEFDLALRAPRGWWQVTAEHAKSDSRFRDGARSKHLDVQVLGRLRVLVGGVDLPLGSPKERALMAALAIHHGVVVPTDRLIEMLWGELAPRTAGHSLQVYVSHLRATFVGRLGDPLIETLGRGYRLVCDPLEVDLGRFEQAVASAREAVADDDVKAALPHLQHAVAAWSSSDLVDVPGTELVETTVIRLEQERDWAIEQLALVLSVEGSAERALELAQGLLTREPLREPPQEAAMLALYRLGRSAEALRTFAKFRQNLAEELGVDPSPRLLRLHEQMLVGDPRLLRPGVRVRPGAAAARPRNPYKGPRAFTEHDAGDFFGREAFVDDLVERVRTGQRLISVVGPSGSGKSSVLAAGLLPRLREASTEQGAARAVWAVVAPNPSTYDLETLGSAVARARLGMSAAGGSRADARILLLLDQFESLFQTEASDAARRIMDGLCEWAEDGDVTVVLALRADRYDRPLQHPQFARLFAGSVVPLLPLTPAQLEASIVEPALRAGVGLESALLTNLIADVGAADAGLPLLQFVLADLFDRRTGHSLTYGDYVAAGGVRTALARRAEEMRAQLSAGERSVLTQVCLRLFRADGSRTALRRMPTAELAAIPELDSAEIGNVIAELVQCRLVVLDSDSSGAPVMSLGHEAILTAWPWLADLVRRARPVVRQHELLMGALEEWDLTGGHVDYLWRGERVDALVRSFGQVGMSLTAGERAFLDAGVERDRSEAEAAAAAERRVVRVGRAARHRLQLLVLALVALVVVGSAWATVVRERPIRVAVADFGGGRIGSDVQLGVDRAAAQGGVEQIKATADLTDVGKLTQSFASAGAGLVITSTLGADIPRVAAANPDTTFFAYADGKMPPVSNVTWAVFADQQTAYLAGAAAAMASTSKRVGFLGGADTPVLRRFEAGYVAGAQAVVPSIKVEIAYVTRVPDYNGFESPSLAAMSASTMLRHGVDVVYAASGASQTGTFQAVIDKSDATHRPLWAIGADDDAWSDQSWQRTLTSRDHILTSTVKRLDVASLEAVRDYETDSLRPGLRIYDLANGGLALAPSGGHLRPYQARLDELRNAVASGRIVVPCVPPGTPTLVARAAQEGVLCPAASPILGH